MYLKKKNPLTNNDLFGYVNGMSVVFDIPHDQIMGILFYFWHLFFYLKKNTIVQFTFNDNFYGKYVFTKH